jgi:hypothetical protein
MCWRERSQSAIMRDRLSDRIPNPGYDPKPISSGNGLLMNVLSFR